MQDKGPVEMRPEHSLWLWNQIARVLILPSISYATVMWSLAGYSPKGPKESATAEHARTYAYIPCFFKFLFSLWVSFRKVLLPFLQVQILSSAAWQLVMSPLETFFIFVAVGFVSSVSFWLVLRVSSSLLTWSICFLLTLPVSYLLFPSEASRINHNCFNSPVRKF